MTKKFEKGCPHCPAGIGLEFPLYDDDAFWLVCDVHPLVRGHILIIPKGHISTMADLPVGDFKVYEGLYGKVKSFLEALYGEVGIFEHGITGQTVFHAHTHFLPFSHATEEIIPDKKALRKISCLEDLKKEFAQNRKYLFFENKDQMWLADTRLGYPKFFRDIFAKLLNAGERADWKKARENQELMRQFKIDISALIDAWKEYNKL